MAKLSVIIPVYNKEKYLKKCIESVLAQSFADIEIVCIDDGSEDTSLAIINKLAKQDKRIIVYSQPNKGVSSARNEGIRLASSPFVTYIDPDDYLIDSLAYENMIKIAESEKSDIVFSYFHHCDKDGGILTDRFKDFCKTKAITFKEKARFIEFAYPWQKIFKIDLFKKHKILFPLNIVYEDNPANLQLLILANQISVYPSHTIKYRPNHSSITMQKSLNAFNMFTAVDLMEKLIHQYHITDRAFITSYIDYRLELLAWGYYSLHNSIWQHLRYIQKWREILTDDDKKRLKECPHRKFENVYKYVMTDNGGLFLLNRIGKHLPRFISYMLRWGYSLIHFRKLYYGYFK